MTKLVTRATSLRFSADGLRPARLFAHYVVEDREEMRRCLSRVHDDVPYELRFP